MLRTSVEHMDGETIARSAEASSGTCALDALVQSFVEVGALEQGKSTLDLARANVVELVEQTVDDLRVLTSAHPSPCDCPRRPARRSMSCASVRS